MTVHGGVCSRVEGVCDGVEYSVVRSMENGVRRGALGENIAMLSCTSSDQDGLGHHMTICIGDVLIHIGGLNSSAFCFLLVYVLLCHDIRVQILCVVGARTILWSYIRIITEMSYWQIPQYHLFG